VVPLITFVMAVFALVVAILNGMGKNNRPPLWLAVVLLSLGMMLPWIISMSIR
jgi:hypothetical protein